MDMLGKLLVLECLWIYDIRPEIYAPKSRELNSVHKLTKRIAFSTIEENGTSSQVPRIIFFDV